MANDADDIVADVISRSQSTGMFISNYYMKRTELLIYCGALVYQNLPYSTIASVWMVDIVQSNPELRPILILNGWIWTSLMSGEDFVDPLQIMTICTQLDFAQECASMCLTFSASRIINSELLVVWDTHTSKLIHTRSDEDDCTITLIENINHDGKGGKGIRSINVAVATSCGMVVPFCISDTMYSHVLDQHLDNVWADDDATVVDDSSKDVMSCLDMEEEDIYKFIETWNDKQ